MNSQRTTAQIWEELGSRIEGFVRKRVKDSQAVEDLVQETFVRIHKRLDKVNDSQRITSWVFQIARNLVVDHYRSEARKASAAAVEVEVGLEEQENINELVTGWLPRMISQLPDNYREAVEMYELQGMPQQQIADKLEISLSGAKSRIQRGREKLKELLFDCCSFEKDRRGNVIGYKKINCDICEDPENNHCQ